MSTADPNWWSCPYCGGANSFDAAACVHCSAQLRDPDESDLFTTVAVDNAEVVPPSVPFGPDSMWSTAPIADPFADEVLEAEAVDDAPLFEGSTAASVGGEASAGGSPRRGSVQDGALPSDTTGLSAAIGRLDPAEQDATVVPFSVVGALLEPDEIVLAAVAGQMLGQPAAVVLSTRRVLVVNGRRWQPIVDVYRLGPDLVVRGRHDRDVAALTFTQGDRMSTVDGITEVGLAVELAERLRTSG